MCRYRRGHLGLHEIILFFIDRKLPDYGCQVRGTKLDASCSVVAATEQPVQISTPTHPQSVSQASPAVLAACGLAMWKMSYLPPDGEPPPCLVVCLANTHLRLQGAAGLIFEVLIHGHGVA